MRACCLATSLLLLLMLPVVRPRFRLQRDTRYRAPSFLLLARQAAASAVLTPLVASAHLQHGICSCPEPSSCSAEATRAVEGLQTARDLLCPGQSRGAVGCAYARAATSAVLLTTISMHCQHAGSHSCRGNTVQAWLSRGRYSGKVMPGHPRTSGRQQEGAERKVTRSSIGAPAAGAPERG